MEQSIPFSVSTDAEGHYTFRGFRGRYQVRVNGKTADFRLVNFRRQAQDSIREPHLISLRQKTSRVCETCKAN